jgi:molybdopterin-containing oxidoreductase family iron-sulfur binding subunit
MVVNLNACVGCNACVVACQAENNIPVVGKEEVLRGREMHWLEIDRYFSGRSRRPGDLPPAQALHALRERPLRGRLPGRRHDAQRRGAERDDVQPLRRHAVLLEQLPYKVRHFNFFEYSAPRAPVLTVLNNPDVTVRSRGVMEKCTYCVQRINAGRIQAKQEGRRSATARS